MGFDSEDEVTRLLKHELGNVLQLLYGYKEEYSGNKEEEESLEEFADSLNNAVGDLKKYDDVGPALESLTTLRDEFESQEFNEEFRRHYRKAEDAAEVAEDYVNYTSGDVEDLISIDEIFESYSGEFELRDCANDRLKVNNSMAYVISTLEDNSHRHGGKEEISTKAVVKCMDNFNAGEYVASSWYAVEKEEYEDHLSELNENSEYIIMFWDDGEGLDEDKRENPDSIFEKGKGENSGLGLHLSRKIVEEFEGEIHVIDEENFHARNIIPEDAGLKIAITLPGKRGWKN